MLGSACNLMILHGFYRALPSRRGEGVPGTATLDDARRQLRRELRIIRKNPGLVIDLFLLRQGWERKGSAIRRLSPRVEQHIRQLLLQRARRVTQQETETREAAPPSEALQAPKAVQGACHQTLRHSEEREASVVRRRCRQRPHKRQKAASLRGRRRRIIGRDRPPRVGTPLAGRPVRERYCSP